MHRRNFLKNTGLLAGAGVLMQQQALANIFRINEFQLRILRDNVGIFTERGGSIGFMLGKDGIVVVDSQFPDTAAHLIEAIKKQSESPFRYLLNTHHHGDHTGGNIAFKGLVENVVSHENALRHLKAGVEKNNNADKVLLPDLAFTEEWELKLGKEKIKGDYYGAAHTNGDAIYHFQNANVMHVGDLMFNKRHPYVDRSAGANMENWIRVLDKIIKKADKNTIIIFGHSLNPGE
ncbi:MAG: MBL fold metallo-hydrolase, partial [Flavisolibacter sp.]